MASMVFERVCQVRPSTLLELHNFMLFAGWKVRIRPRVAVSRPRSQFFPIRKTLIHTHVASLAYVCFIPAKGLIRDPSANSSNIAF